MEGRKEIVSHLVVAFVYFGLVSFFSLHLGLDLISFWLGALIGAFLLDVDHVLLGLNSETKTEWAVKFRSLWQQKKYQEALQVCFESHLEHRRLIFHSALFQPILLLLSFFVLTSTGSLFGVGLVMSMNLHLLKDEWQTFLGETGLNWIFWPIKRRINQEGQKVYLWAMTFVFLLLSLLLL